MAVPPCAFDAAEVLAFDSGLLEVVSCPRRADISDRSCLSCACVSAVLLDDTKNAPFARQACDEADLVTHKAVELWGEGWLKWRSAKSTGAFADRSISKNGPPS